MEKSIFTYGITVHDGMEFNKFKNSINSVLTSYKEMEEKNTPIDVIISMDSETEEEFLKRPDISKLDNDEKNKKLIEFRNNKNSKREFIKEIEEQIKKEELNINLDVIESAKKYGKVSDSRNRLIDVCKTKYIAFLDGDDKIKKDALQHYINECKNNDLGNSEGRKNYPYGKGEIKGELDIIYLETNSQKVVWGNIYNIQTLRDKEIRFTKQIGDEDGYIKAAILQNNLKIAYAKKENLGITDNYEASNSTIADGKIFESVIQLTNHLLRHNKNGLNIDTNKIFGPDPNDIFHYFSSGNYDRENIFLNNGFGFIFKQNIDNQIILEEEREIEAVFAIICSLIIYPEVLADNEGNKETRECFKKIRKELIKEIKNNKKKLV